MIENKDNITLESNIDFGDPLLNETFQNLDENIQKEILTRYPNKDIQISILRNISNPELQNIYDNLNEKMKAKLDALGIQ